MNIKDAKTQIKNAIVAYFTKDEFGNNIIPIHQQRPVFLMGPPGIGKTAVMEQIASELSCSLVAYSMTHHTRQSALGLPFITKKNYGGKEYEVSEYTMSEIIASVYDMIESTGKKEGILFLDEINCISETLAPSMLQFLQYKVFGKHRIPDGWIVVTAGNPPEYNNSVRDFDIVTWDRLKRIDVEPDFDAWKEHAYNKSVHPSIMTYLETKKESFYKIETTVDGKSFVTARGWSDLSDMIKLYEMNNIAVDDMLICQYIQNRTIAKEFAIYYDLFNKYKSSYEIDTILDGQASDKVKNRAKNARMDERFALIGMLLDKIMSYIKDVHFEENVISLLLSDLKTFKGLGQTDSLDKAITSKIELNQKTIEKEKISNALSDDRHKALLGATRELENYKSILIFQTPASNTEAFAILAKEYNKKLENYKSLANETKDMLDNIFKFCDEVFGDADEMLILVTELTVSYYGAHFISRHGSEEYFRHNKKLLFHERHKKIHEQIEKLNLED